MGPLVVSAGTSYLLVVAVYRFADGVVDHESHVWLVDPHAERNRRDDDVQSVLHELRLNLVTQTRAQSRMVGSSAHAATPEIAGQFFGIMMGGGVHDSRIRRPLNEIDERRPLLVEILTSDDAKCD